MKTKASTILLVLAFIYACTSEAQSYLKINSEEVTELLSKNVNLIVIDVRTPEEFSHGHIKGAVNLNLHKPDFYSELEKMDKSKKYLVYCRTSNRSGVAVNYMKEHGFNTVYQMMDGMVGWNRNQLPLEKD